MAGDDTVEVPVRDGLGVPLHGTTREAREKRCDHVGDVYAHFVFSGVSEELGVEVVVWVEVLEQWEAS